PRQFGGVLPGLFQAQLPCVEPPAYLLCAVLSGLLTQRSITAIAQGEVIKKSAKGDHMKRSTDRILTTHTGSLPRPADLISMLQAKETAQPYDLQAFGQQVQTAVAE